jgi:oxygen-independent coproporphyrinogen-3 oxidase
MTEASSHIFPAALIRKYNRPGPRYTSYPTAPHFKADCDRGELIRALGDSERKAEPLSVYVHLPFCESNCWFCGCTKIVTGDHSAADRYLDYLAKELDLLSAHLDASRPLVQLHFGGGTPTFLNAAQLRRLDGLLKAHFNFSSDGEFGVEIDPRRLCREQIDTLAAMGFNRASLGVQDHNAQVQEAIHRIQPRELTDQALNWLRDAGFRSINIDLIYGLPLQTENSFAETVEAIIGQRPDRIALFSYAHVPWIKPTQTIFERRGNLPDDATKLAIFEQTTARLMAAGYEYIGMDHFALPGDELLKAREAGRLQRNFQGYSTHGGADICGLGMSAISQTTGTYRQNHKKLKDYYAALDGGELPISGGYVLSQDDQIRRETIMRLMCDLRLDFTHLSDQLGIVFADYFAPALEALQPMADDGLVTMGSDYIEVTATGRFLIRNIAMHFDAFLGQSKARYSKTV